MHFTSDNLDFDILNFLAPEQDPILSHYLNRVHNVKPFFSTGCIHFNTEAAKWQMTKPVKRIYGININLH